MNIYEFIVKEVVAKRVVVEANTEEEAEQIALEEDMSKDFDDYSLTAELLEVGSDVDVWPSEGDNNMTYWKRVRIPCTEEHVVAVCLMEANGAEADDGTGAMRWSVLIADGSSPDEALEALDIMPACIADGLPRMEAEAALYAYMASH